MSDSVEVGTQIVDLRFVEAAAATLARSETASVDLSSVVHDRARHSDLVPCSVFAWWLASTELAADKWTLVLPPPGSAPLRHLARAGLTAAAAARRTSLVYPNGRAFEMAHLHRDATMHQPRLPAVDWDVLDDLDGDRLRVIPDLADLRRAVPKSQTGRLAYPWLAKLGLASPSVSPVGYQRLLADANAVLRELIDNVHRWSRASTAFATVSVTRGGARDGEEHESWHRLHIVVSDNGVGVPQALRHDLDAFRAVHSAGDDSTPLDSLSDGALVERLLQFAFGRRDLPNHNGHGLNVAQIRAGQWIGAFDIVTVDGERCPFRRGSRGLAPEHFETDDHVLQLPGASGTLVHLLLQATDNSRTRKVAADSEQLFFEPKDFEEATERAYALLTSASA